MPDLTKVAMPVTVPLADAKLCLNCEYISNATKETCPQCAAPANWLILANILGTLPAECTQVCAL